MPPSFQRNTIDLVSVNDSRITRVSLYSSRAEITRVFRFEIKAGFNQVNISGLPNVLDKNSFNVQGTTPATIHDVTISNLPVLARPTSDKLEELLRKKNKTEKAIDRCTLAINSLQTYLGTLDVKDVGVSEIANAITTYQTTGEGLDDELIRLRDELDKTESEVALERESLTGHMENQQLRKRASIGVSADGTGEVEIKLTYGVHRASWSALYDIQVDPHTEGAPVELTYKASIVQTTGEDWKDIELTLETAKPTLDVDIPHLSPWTISVSVPASHMTRPAARRAKMIPRTTVFCSLTEGARPTMAHPETGLRSPGNIPATFVAPKKITILSDGSTLIMTIVKLNLGAKIYRITTPKREAKILLSAKIKNVPSHVLLDGEVNIYVSGTFIARTRMPTVGPEEIFDCPLGFDPAVRVTYHPRSKKTTHTGFYNKTTTHMYKQRITVFNSMTSSIDDLKVTDQFPVSDDSSSITVKRVNPPLGDVFKEKTSGEIRIPGKLKVSPDVFAQWHGADEPDADIEFLGEDGKFDWICTVPGQGKIDLVLQYEVTAPLRASISGL